MTTVSATKDFYAIRVRLNDLPHLVIPLDRFVGLQAWIRPRPTIEFTMEAGAPITSEYEDVETWRKILTALDPIL